MVSLNKMQCGYLKLTQTITTLTVAITDLNEEKELQQNLVMRKM